MIDKGWRGVVAAFKPGKSGSNSAVAHWFLSESSSVRGVPFEKMILTHAVQRP